MIVLLLTVAALVVPALPAAGAPPAPASFIVGFHAGVDEAALAAAGTHLVAKSAGLRIAVVTAPVPEAAAAALARNPAVAFVETNGQTRWSAVATAASGWDLDGDASGWDASGWDASGWDASGWDASGWDASGWDASGWDGSNWDASGWDASGWDSSQWDASGWDASGWDASGWDASGWDASGWDGSNWDASGWDGSNWDASGWDSATLTAMGQGNGTQGAADPLNDKQWGLRAVNASGAFHAFKARNTQKICILDSGVDYTHPDLASRMYRDPQTGAYGRDLVNNDADPMDDAGHGTHVAGIAAAAIRNGRGITGMSPERIMAVKVLDAHGVGTEANLALGIEWCVDHGASVISMSLGTPEESPALYRAVQYAHNRSVAMVASIGNQGDCSTCVRFPAAYGEVAAVGALRPDGRVPRFSSVSNAVDFGAPGVAIVSTYPGDRYASFNGTSMAAPFVAASVGLLLDAQPALDATAALRILASTAEDMGPAGKDPYVGYGAINLGRALDKAMAAERGA